MIKMIILDVDGTLTDGSIGFVNVERKICESKNFNAKDGLGITEWIKQGGIACIISGRNCTITTHRAKELGIHEVHLGIDNKVDCLRDISNRYKMSPDNIACIGDDINDLGMYEFCKYSFAPVDASIENKNKASFVTKARGGHGAVREMIDVLILLNKYQDRFQ